MKKFLSLVLALVMTMSLVTISAGAKDFTDSSSVDYDVAVQVMSEVKVVEGYPDDSFQPTKTLTRAEAAKVICNLVLGPTTAAALKADTAPFSDVPTSHWAAGYIAYCAQQDIIKGYGDGVFGVNDNLTGYQYMKMLLVALGYDTAIEGYTGANWSINVAKRALQLGLDNGNEAFNGNKAVTREEACLYAFNTLKADLVEYDGKTTINVGGTEVTVGASSAKSVTTTIATDGNKINNETGTTKRVQFGEKYFTNLERKANQYDDLGRPSYVWKLKTRVIATETLTPDAVFTTGTKQKDVASELDLDGTTYFYYYVDGVYQGDAGTLSVTRGSESSKALKSNDGKVVETYLDFNGKNIAVVINPEIVEIIDEDEDNDGRYVKDENGKKFHTEEFADGDFVEVYYGHDGSNAVIVEMKIAEKQTGKLTKWIDTKWTIGGTGYTLSESANLYQDVSIGISDTVDFWLDSYGYVLKVKQNTPAVKVENLAYVLAEGTERGSWARLIFSDGTKKIVDTDKLYNYYVSTPVVEFDLDGGDYELQDRTTYVGTGAYYFTKGTTSIKWNNSGSKTAAFSVDAKTTFVYVDTDYSAKAYVGYKNAPSFDEATTVAAYAKQAGDPASLVYVFVPDAKVSGNSSDVVFFIPKADGYDLTQEEDLDDYYTVPAIVNGEYKKLNVKDGSNADDDGITYYGNNAVYGAKELKLNSDGQVVDKVAASHFTLLNVAAATSKAVANDVVTLGTNSYAFNDKTNVYFVASDRKSMEVGTVAQIRTDDNVNKDYYTAIALTTDDDGVLTNVVLIKK